MNTYEVECGLGRLGTHHVRTVTIQARNKDDAYCRGSREYNGLIGAELAGNPILGKCTTVNKINLVEFETIG